MLILSATPAAPWFYRASQQLPASKEATFGPSEHHVAATKGARLGSPGSSWATQGICLVSRPLILYFLEVYEWTVKDIGHLHFRCLVFMTLTYGSINNKSFLMNTWRNYPFCYLSNAFYHGIGENSPKSYTWGGCLELRRRPSHAARTLPRGLGRRPGGGPAAAPADLGDGGETMGGCSVLVGFRCL